MKVLRTIIAIVCGYAIFVISAVLLFKLSRIDPHADPSPGLLLFILMYGLSFSFIAGLTTQGISRSGSMTTNYILALIIAGFATFSLFKTTGSHYSQFAAIFLFAPASVLAGLIRLRKTKK